MNLSAQTPREQQPPQPSYVLLVAWLAVFLLGLIVWPPGVGQYVAEIELELPSEEARAAAARWEAGEFDFQPLPDETPYTSHIEPAAEPGRSRLTLSAGDRVRSVPHAAPHQCSAHLLRPPFAAPDAREQLLEKLMAARTELSQTQHKRALREEKLMELLASEPRVRQAAAEPAAPLGPGDTTVERRENPRWQEVFDSLTSARGRLEGLSGLTAQHPRVIGAREEITRLEQQLAEIPRYLVERPNVREIPPRRETIDPRETAPSAELAAARGELAEARAAEAKAMLAESTAWQRWLAERPVRESRLVLEPAHITEEIAAASIVRPVVLAAAGLVAGLLLALLARVPLAAVVIRDPEEAANALGIPLVGNIPTDSVPPVPPFPARRIRAVRWATRGCELVMLLAVAILLAKSLDSVSITLGAVSPILFF